MKFKLHPFETTRSFLEQRAGLLLLSVALVFSSCTVKEQEAGLARSSLISTQGLEYFKTDFKPWVSEYCGQCHASQQTPLFAHSDDVVAYLAAKTIANLDDPSSGRMASRGSDGHSNCGSRPDGGCSQNLTDILFFSDEWSAVDVVSDSVDVGTVLTAQVLPGGLAFSPGAYTTMTFSLASLGPAFSAATLSFGIRIFTTGFYEVADLAYSGPAVTLPAIYIRTNASRTDQETTFDYVAGSYAANPGIIGATSHLVTKEIYPGDDVDIHIAGVVSAL